MANGLTLAIEGGGTHTRVVLGGEWGGVMRESRGGPGSALYVDHEAYPRDLARMISDVIAGGDPPAVVGCAGPMNRELVSNVLAQNLPGVPMRWYSEGEIALGVYGLTWGVTIVAGTGSSSCAIAPDRRSVETGGFGPQFDDLGSAYWIGREAVAAVLRAEQGRGSETALRETMLTHFGANDCWGLVPLCVGNGHVPVPQVAAFAVAVTQAAAEGDAIARGICATAVEHLAALVETSAQRGGLATLSDVPLVPTGGVFRARAEIYLPFRERLEARAGAFTVCEAAPDPVIGLLNLLARD